MKTTPFASRSRRSPLTVLSAVVAVVLSAASSFAAVDPGSITIQKLVDENLAKAGQKPNAPVSDAAFCRRIYLDVIGRVPTAEEAMAYLNDQSADKREKLIDKLLASEGYVSHWFNFWADILRVQSRPNANTQVQTGDVYASWVKNSLRSNMPYNKFVHSLVTAQGYIWDNGAVGYYMRDAGMPLDNMSNTVQVFLGSRVACAQCHNHPFDAYNQRDYYEMAAYTCGMDTKIGAKEIIAEATGKTRMTKRDAEKAVKPGVARVLENLLEPLSYGTRENPDRMQKLPDDFRGDPKNPDPKLGKPGEEVKPEPVFGKRTDIKVKGGKILENYADWMTSQENPTFTVVVANRLWKQAMGIGLIEPVDDIKKIDLEKNNGDASKLSINPQLMGFLVQEMRRKNYDMKAFLRMIFNSAAYQREATSADVVTVEEYRFPGPMLRRMTAEQMWDSFVTMVIPAPDERKSKAAYLEKLAEMKAEADKLADKLKAGGGKALLAYAEDLAKIENEFDMKTAPLRTKLQQARQKEDAKAIADLTKQIEAIEGQRFDARKKASDEQKAREKAAKSSSLFSDNKATGFTPMDKKKMDEATIPSAADDVRWQGYGGEWIRASELSSPAPESHFLRQFGQSDRETIQHASRESTMTQALDMLNGPLFGQLTAKNTILGQILSGMKTADEKRDQLFLTVLGRHPNEKEKAIVAARVQSDGNETALRKIAWALINTKEFAFIQ